LLARWYLYVIFSREALGGFGSADRSGSRRTQAPNEAVERIKALSCDKPIEWEEYNEFHARLARHENGIVGEIAQR
jgi:hypothetical protein